MRAHHDPRPTPQMPDPACTCNKPIGIVVPPGDHIHPCPVHPDVVIYGYGTYSDRHAAAELAALREEHKQAVLLDAARQKMFDINANGNLSGREWSEQMWAAHGARDEQEDKWLKAVRAAAALRAAEVTPDV